MTSFLDFGFLLPAQPAQVDFGRAAIVDDSRDLDLLTAQQAAEIVQCDASTIYRLARQGALRSVRMGGMVRIRRGDLAEYVRQSVK
jgi:excisionase family DNA binding protein